MSKPCAYALKVFHCAIHKKMVLYINEAVVFIYNFHLLLKIPMLCASLSNFKPSEALKI